MCAFVCEALPLPLLVLAKTVLPPAIARAKMTQAIDIVLMQSRCFDHTASALLCFTPESGRQDSPAVSSHRDNDITHHAIDFPSSAANNFASCP